MAWADPVFLWMRGDGNNRNLFLVRTIVPEYSVSGRSGLLRIGFEDFLSIWSYETGKFVSLKALVSRILGKKMDSLFNGMISFFKALVLFQPLQLIFSRIG